MKFSMLCPVASLLLCGKLLAEEEAFHINPYLQNVTPTSMTVMWESREAMLPATTAISKRTLPLRRNLEPKTGDS